MHGYNTPFFCCLIETRFNGVARARGRSTDSSTMVLLVIALTGHPGFRTTQTKLPNKQLYFPNLQTHTLKTDSRKANKLLI
jgi:hypothetical protein